MRTGFTTVITTVALLAAVSTVVIGFKRRLRNCAAIKGQTVLKTFSLKLIEITPRPKIAAVLLNTCRTPTFGFILSYILMRVKFHLVFRSQVMAGENVAAS